MEWKNPSRTGLDIACNTQDETEIRHLDFPAAWVSQKVGKVWVRHIVNPASSPWVLLQPTLQPPPPG